MAIFFTWVGRAAHGGHAVRTLSREGDAATVTRRRTDVPPWWLTSECNTRMAVLALLHSHLT